MIDSKVRHLYKQFIFLARDYPGGLETARAKIKAAFRAVPTDDPQAVKKALVTGVCSKVVACGVHVDFRNTKCLLTSSSSWTAFLSASLI